MLYCGGRPVVKCLHKQADIIFFSKAFYSRRNNSDFERYYKVLGKVGGANKVAKNFESDALAPIPNWELLTPQGYRFFMPGNTGPGWHDANTTAHSLPQDFDLEASDLTCHAQNCPTLLREGVNELFPGINLRYAQLTIMSLSQKKKLSINEHDTEEFTKKFVLTAQEICRRLKTGGYWSDFINPFSGLPCINAYTSNINLYQTDPRFRCVGFRIVEQESCRVIEDKQTRRFIGNLFTTAPANAEILQGILLRNDDDD